MTDATATFLTKVRRFRTGVYSSVAAAEAAMMARSAGGSYMTASGAQFCAKLKWDVRHADGHSHTVLSLLYAQADGCFTSYGQEFKLTLGCTL